MPTGDDMNRYASRTSDTWLANSADNWTGLIDRHCPHRRADMKFGFWETCGLRCCYQGWLFDHTGACVSQPFEETDDVEGRFKDKIRIKAYPVEVKGGLVWAYFGPDPAPLVPNYEPFEWGNGFIQIGFSEIPCNWFQCQETYWTLVASGAQ